MKHTVQSLLAWMALAVSVAAERAGPRGGDLPGGMLSTKPGVGGVGVPGQLPGGTLSTTPGVGGVGVPGQVPGGTLGTAPACGEAGCNPALALPGSIAGPTPAPPEGSAAPAQE